jgi:hypothetical protein
VYLDRATIERWLADNAAVEPGSAYVTMRNGNSWKFGGVSRIPESMKRSQRCLPP